MSLLRRLLNRVPGSADRWFVWAWVLAVSLLVGITFARTSGEDARFRRTIAAEQARQAAEAEKRNIALCRDWKGRAEADVTDATGDLGRVIVRTAAANYTLIGCAKRAGPLMAGKPDREAYQPAPR